ncbi:MAG: membrane protease YdiL (CAAX protease family) [Myxococcota bacterium]|jgi:membrane protease YdiL (CAAX protease family)
MTDLLAATALWVLLSAAMLWWSHQRRVQGVVWSVGDGFAALLVMIWCSSMGSLIFVRMAAGSWTPDGPLSLVPAVLGTGVGGLLTIGFIRLRAGWSALGFVRCEPVWLLRGAIWVVGFLGVSFAWGLLLQVLGVGAQQEIGLVVMESWPSSEAALMIAYGVAVAPLVEELLFRGFLLPPLAARLGARGGIAMSALLFGMMHLADPQAVPPLIILGAVLGWLRLRSGSLWPVLVLHVGNNAVAFSLLLLSQHLEGAAMWY